MVDRLRRSFGSRVLVISGILLLGSITIIVLALCLDLRVGDILALISLVLVLIIAAGQQHDLTLLKRIGEETKSIGEETKSIGEETKRISEETKGIARQIHSDKCLEENASDFFKYSRGDGKSYVIICPVEFKEKPLPLIHAGDFYALQVLTKCLGSERIQFGFFPRGKSPKLDNENSDRIYICASDANPSTKEAFHGVEMPCWIDKTKDSAGQEIKIIRITEGQVDLHKLPSPSEEIYQEARMLSVDQLFENYRKRREYADFGILARVTKDNRRQFLIAGIHQQGTWIVAAFLEELLVAKRTERTSMFFQPYDFAVIIEGTFQASLLQHSGVDVALGYRWQKKQDKWQRVEGRDISHLGT